MIFLIIAHLTANDKDFSLSLEMTIRESPSHQSLVTSHQPLTPAFNREPINPNLFIQRMKSSHAVPSPTDGSRGGDGYGGVPTEKSRGEERRRFLPYEAHLHAEPAHSFGSAGGSALGASSDVPGFSPGFPSFLASACFCAARSSILALYSLAVCLKLSFASAALA